MKFELKLEPFHHIVIEDFYDEESKQKVLSELIEFGERGLYFNPEYSGSAITADSELIKKNVALLDQPILYETYFQKYFNDFMQRFHNDKNVHENIMKKSWFFSNRFPFKSSVMVSYYENGDYYKPHEDYGAFTFLTWINKEPKKFIGGDLYFPNFDYTIKYKNNMMVCFFSRILHSVTDIRMRKTDGFDGRFCITNFMSADE